MAIKSREELKARFQTNKIPSEVDFANLIDSALNQADDGVIKNPNDPISIEGNGNNQELLAFYKNFKENQLAWRINQKPGDKAGLNIAAKDGTSRLFIDENSGSTQIGGTNPHIIAGSTILQVGDSQTPGVNGELILARMKTDGGNRAYKFGINDSFHLTIGDYGYAGNHNYTESIEIRCNSGYTAIKKGLEVNGVLDAKGDTTTQKLTVNGVLDAKNDTTTQKLTVAGLLDAKGDTTTQKLTVAGALEAKGDSAVQKLTVNGLVDAKAHTNVNSLVVNGLLEAKNDTITGKLTSNGFLEAKNNLQVNGTFEAKGNAVINGATHAKDELNIEKGIKVKGGVIRWGEGMPEGTVDPGLYSTNKGIYMKFATKEAPFKFFISPDGKNVASGTPKVTIDINGTLVIGSDSGYGIDGSQILQIGHDNVEGSKGEIILGRKKGGCTRSFKMGMTEDGSFSMGDYGNSVGKTYKEFLQINWDTGNVGIGCTGAGSKLSVNGTFHVAGVQNESNFPVQGAYMTWNKDGGEGRTHFVNIGGGGDGGFMFENKKKDNALMRVAHINYFGDLFLAGDWKGHKALAGSDLRIKKNIQSSNGLQDLSLINKLRVTDYDYAGKGKNTERQKGVIAQEIEKLIPDAVTQETAFVADIFAQPLNITVAGDELVFNMAQPHNLVTGDKVRLITSNGDFEPVVTVADDTAFIIKGKIESFDDVLVYGKQVPDFRRVNYNHLFMLNLSATQELSKKIDTLLAWKASAEKNMVLAD